MTEQHMRQTIDAVSIFIIVTSFNAATLGESSPRPACEWGTCLYRKRLGLR